MGLSILKTQTLRRVFREVAIIQSLATDRLTAVLPPELTVQQFSLMSHLVNTQNGPESPGDLAQIFQVSRPAMTQLLQRLQARGKSLSLHQRWTGEPALFT